MSTEVTRVVYKETNTEDFTGRKEPLNPASLRSTGVLRAACPASDRELCGGHSEEHTKAPGQETLGRRKQLCPRFSRLVYKTGLILPRLHGCEAKDVTQAQGLPPGLTQVSAHGTAA